MFFFCYSLVLPIISFSPLLWGERPRSRSCMAPYEANQTLYTTYSTVLYTTSFLLALVPHLRPQEKASLSLSLSKQGGEGLTTNSLAPNERKEEEGGVDGGRWRRPSVADRERRARGKIETSSSPPALLVSCNFFAAALFFLGDCRVPFLFLYLLLWFSFLREARARPEHSNSGRCRVRQATRVAIHYCQKMDVVRIEREGEGEKERESIHPH